MLRGVAVILCFVALVNQAAAEDKRVALVIGNSKYQNVNSLKNPASDATDMSAVLSRLGFNVTTLTDGSASATRKALGEFAERTKSALISLVFYSGHAVESGGVTWLVPVDGKADSLASVAKDAINLDQLLAAMAQVRDIAIVFIDAGRDDPFPGQALRAQPSTSDATAFPSNVLIGFATRSGRSVADGEGRNSPYTAALLKHLATERVSLQKIMIRVRDDVMSTTKREQQPFVYGSFSEDVFLVP